MTAEFHIPLAAEQQAVAAQLQGALVDLLDLVLIGKHLRWNVEGRQREATVDDPRPDPGLGTSRRGHLREPCLIAQTRAMLSRRT